MYHIKPFKETKIIMVSEKNSFQKVICAFGTRSNGRNPIDFNSLNLFNKALKIYPKKIITYKQVHSDTISIISPSTNLGITKNISADAIITNRKELPIGVYTADCIPVVLFDKLKNVVAVVHAGRSGTLKEITKKVVKKMISHYGSSPNNIMAIIGPGIGKCCYKVSKNIIEFTKESLTWGGEIILSIKNNFFLDLPLANKLQILNCHIPAENIFSIDLCTSCNINLFFSYRKEGEKAGRMMNMIMLK